MLLAIVAGALVTDAAFDGAAVVVVIDDFNAVKDGYVTPPASETTSGGLVD